MTWQATEEETELAHHAARLLGLITPGQALAFNELQAFVDRWRAIDKPSILAREMAPIYNLQNAQNSQ